MAGYQFFHVESYARIPSKSLKKQSARGVAREAERAPEACLHIENPHPYKLMYGCTPSQAVDLAEERAKQGKDKLGRKLRKDAQIILAGVASYPVPIAELHPKDEDLNYWLKLNYKFLKGKYGNKVKSIVCHTDEKFLHIHFYIIPDLDEDGRFNIGEVHDGILARDLVGGSKAKEKMRAYKAAMRALQDEYYKSVGKLCGLTREGANKRRLSRSAWKIEQAAAERFAKSLKTIDEIETKTQLLNIEQEELLESKKRLLDKESKLIGLKVDADKQFDQIEEQKRTVINLQAEKDNVVKYLKNKLQVLKEKANKLLRTNALLKDDNQNLKKEVSSLTKINEKLSYQNELRAKALKRERTEILALVKLVASGNFNEVIEKYNNNNKEYTL